MFHVIVLNSYLPLHSVRERAFYCLNGLIKAVSAAGVQVCNLKYALIDSREFWIFHLIVSQMTAKTDGMDEDGVLSLSVSHSFKCSIISS